MNEECDYIVTYYFTSGETVRVQYLYKTWKEHISVLKKGWETCSMTDLGLGINFSQVTHYTAEKVEK